MKGDAAKIVEYGEKSLASEERQPDEPADRRLRHPHAQFINLHQSDEEKQLTKAESYCQEAIKAVNDLKKRPTSRTRILPTAKPVTSPASTPTWG